MAKKTFPFSIKISAVDKAAAQIRRVRESVKGLAASTKKAREQFKLMAKEANLSGSVNNLKTSVKGLAVAAVAAGASAFKMISSFTMAGDELAKTSDKLGIGIEFLQKMQFAGKKTGVDVNTMNMALQRFGRRVGEAAAGTGEAQVALKALGISVFDAKGNVRDLESLLPEVANKLSKIENANVRNALAMKFFDSEGVKLVNTFKDGSAGLEEYFKEAEKYGIITEEQARQSEEYEDAITELKASLAGVRNVIAGELVPSLTVLIKQVSNFIAENREGISSFISVFSTLFKWFVAFKALNIALSLLAIAKAMNAVGLATMIAANPVAALFAAFFLGYQAGKLLVALLQKFPGIWGGIVTVIGGSIAFLVDAVKALGRLGAAVARFMGFGGGNESTPSKAPGAAAQSAQGGTAGGTVSGKIGVEFGNLPEGSAVSAESSDNLDLELSQGQTSAGPA